MVSRALTPAPSFILGSDALSSGGQILSLSHAAGREHVVTLANDHSVNVFDVAAGRRIARHVGRNLMPFVAFDDHGALFVDSGSLCRLESDGAVVRIGALEEDGHGFRVEEARASAGGRVVVLYEERSAPHTDTERRLRVVDGRSGATLRTIAIEPDGDPHAGKPTKIVVHAVGVTPDGHRILALASRQPKNGSVAQPVGGLVLVWDAATGERVARATSADAVFLGNPSSLARGVLAFSPDSSAFVTGWGAVRIFDAHTGALVRELETSGCDRAVLVDRDTVIAAGHDGITALDVASGEVRKVQTYGKRAFVLGLSVSDDGRSLAIADDRALLLFALPSFERRHAPSGHENLVRAVAVSPDGARVASADGATLIVADRASSRVIFRRPSRTFFFIAFAPDGDRFVTDFEGTTPHVLDARSGETLARSAQRATASTWPEADRLVHVHYEETADADAACEVVVSEGAEGREVARLPSPYLRCVPALSHDGKRFVVHDEYKAHGWDVDRRQRLWTRDIECTTVALSPDGALAAAVAFGNRDKLLFLDALTGADVGKLGVTGLGVSHVLAWSPRGDRVAASVDGGKAVVIDLDPALARTHASSAMRARQSVLEIGAEVSALGFSADGAWLAAGCGDGRVLVYELGAPAALDDLAPPAGAAAAVPLVAGAKVRLVDSAFAGFEGKVIAIDDASQQVTVEVSMFGNPTPIIAERGDLELLPD